MATAHTTATARIITVATGIIGLCAFITAITTGDIGKFAKADSAGPQPGNGRAVVHDRHLAGLVDEPPAHSLSGSGREHGGSIPFSDIEDWFLIFFMFHGVTVSRASLAALIFHRG
jgi:hypothetical protein